MAETTIRSRAADASRNVGPSSILDSQTDRQLLEQFIQASDHPAATAAFTALVDRHGPMVFRVCLHVLNDTHDAQDAFQATFIVLASQSSSIRKYDSIASWLYGVANRVANRARSQSLKRQAHQQRYAEVITTNAHNTNAEPAESWEELYQEIASLPEKLRLPVILCYLEGLTADAAATQLGCPRGTVLSRLSKARACLRDRLTRRGLAIPSILLASSLISQTATAAVPLTLSHAVVQSAVLIAAGKTAAQTVAAPIAGLAQHTMKTLFITKIQNTIAILSLTATTLAVTCGATLLAFQSSLLPPRSSTAAASTELTAICQTWDENASKILGQINIQVTERRFIATETPKAYSSRPSIARFNPPKVTHVKYKKPIQTTFVANNQIATNQFRLEKYVESANQSSLLALIANWNDSKWKNLPKTQGVLHDPLLHPSFVNLYGLPYPGAFHYATEFYKYTSLIKDRNSTLEQVGKLFKIHAPVKDSASSITYFTFWLDPAKGMMPTRLEEGVSDQPPTIRVDNELEQVSPGTWAPVRMLVSEMITDRDSPFFGAVSTEFDHSVNLTTSQIGTPPAPTIFIDPIPDHVQVINWTEGTVRPAGQPNVLEPFGGPPTNQNPLTQPWIIPTATITFLAILSGLALWFLRKNH